MRSAEGARERRSRLACLHWLPVQLASCAMLFAGVLVCVVALSCSGVRLLQSESLQMLQCAWRRQQLRDAIPRRRCPVQVSGNDSKTNANWLRCEQFNLAPLRALDSFKIGHSFCGARTSGRNTLVTRYSKCHCEMTIKVPFFDRLAVFVCE